MGSMEPGDLCRDKSLQNIYLEELSNRATSVECVRKLT